MLKLVSLRNDPDNLMTFLPPSSPDDDDPDIHLTMKGLPAPPLFLQGRSTSSSSLQSGGVPISFELNLERQLSERMFTDVAMNPAMDNVLAAGSSRRIVELWDLVSCSSRSLLTLDSASITRLSWQVSDPNTLLIGATDGLLRVADVRSDKPVHTIMATKSREIRDCQFNPHDNCTLAACFDNGTVQTFDSRQPKQCARRMIVHDGAALCLQYHPTRSGILATGGASGSFAQTQASYKLKVIAPDREAFQVKSVRVPGVSSLCWRRSSTNEIATGLDSRYDHDVHLWNYEDPFFLPLSRFEGHSNTVTRISFLSSLPADDDHVLSVGKDGRIVLQRYAHRFIPKRGNAVRFGSSSTLLASDDPVTPLNTARRGKANLHEFSLLTEHNSQGGGGEKTTMMITAAKSQDDQFIALSKLYSFGPFKSIHDACAHNRIAGIKAGNQSAAGFWATLGTWMTVGDELLTPAKSSQTTSPRAAENGFSSTLSNNVVNRAPSLGGGGVSSLLKELNALDPSMAKTFRIRTKLQTYRQLANDLNGLLSEQVVEPESKVDEPHVSVIPLLPASEGSKAVIGTRESLLKDRIACVGRALDLMVDKQGDVQTAVVCVLTFDSLGLPLPASLARLKRWSMAYCELLERRTLFPEALEFSQETNRLLNAREEDPESRIGMACGACDEPLRIVGPDGDCTACHRVVSQCAVCRRVVHGLYVTCLKCGHGGHLAHLQDWFAENVECPSGCQCECRLSEAMH